MLACTRGNASEVELLLQYGTNASCRGEFGATPLIKAAEQGHSAITALLINHGTSVNAQDDNGDSALLCACRMGHIEVVRDLLAAGADVGLVNSQSNNALDAALQARNLLGRPEVSELMLAHRSGCNDLHSTAEGSAEKGTDAKHHPVAWLPLRLRSNRPDGETTGASSSAAGSMGALVLRLKREEWAQDRNYPQCHHCKANFTVFNRRHHCRVCGLIFCEKCTASTVSTAGARMVSKT